MAARVYVDFQTVKRTISIPEVLEVLGIAERFSRKGTPVRTVSRS